MEGLSQFWSNFRAKNPNQLPRIAFADSSDERIISAQNPIKDLKIAEPILVKSETKDPLDASIELLLKGEVDGLIAGASRPTADIVKAAIKKIGPAPGYRFVSGQFLFESESTKTHDQTPFLFADCAVVPEPSPRILASIATSAAESFHFFTGKTPKIALLSFSTRGSASHPLVDRIRETLDILKRQNPDLSVDGELQVDAAMDPQVAKIKHAGDSSVAGQANVFIFPTLEAGNIGYKLTQRFTKARVAGPLLWGLKKPMSDLSRGCTVQEIIDTTCCVAKMVEGRKW